MCCILHVQLTTTPRGEDQGRILSASHVALSNGCGGEWLTQDCKRRQTELLHILVLSFY